MAFLGWPHAYSLSAYAPVLDGDKVLIQSSEDIFAFAVRTGALRWATARPMPHLAPPAWTYPTPALLRPAVSPRLMVARVRSRGPANGEQLSVLEAREPEDGQPPGQPRPTQSLRHPLREPAFDLCRSCTCAVHKADGQGGRSARRRSTPTMAAYCGARNLPAISPTSSKASTCGIAGPMCPTSGTSAIQGQQKRMLLQYDHCGPPIVADGICYATTDIGLIAAVDVFDGAVLWLRSYPRAHYPSGSQTESRLQALRAPPQLLVPAVTWWLRHATHSACSASIVRTVIGSGNVTIRA